MRTLTEIPVLAPAAEVTYLRSTHQMVQCHHSISARQAQAVTHTLKRLNENQQEWQQYLERGQELQTEKARLMTELGLSMFGLYTVLGNMGEVLKD